MKKEEVWEIAEKVGTTKENFEFGWKNNKKQMVEQYVKAAEFLGLADVEESEDDEEDVEESE